MGVQDREWYRDRLRDLESNPRRSHRPQARGQEPPDLPRWVPFVVKGCAWMAVGFALALYLVRTGRLHP